MQFVGDKRLIQRYTLFVFQHAVSVIGSYSFIQNQKSAVFRWLVLPHQVLLTIKHHCMKRMTKLIILLPAIGFISLAAAAQESARSDIKLPKWISDKGYWVVEGNIHQPQEHTVHFYNVNDVEVYKEIVTGKLKATRRKTMLRMKSILETAVIAWERNQPLTGNEKLFIAAKQRK